MKLIYLLTAPLVGARVVKLQQQTPILGNEIEKNDAKRTVHDEAAPVVGVHFTTSYAVAAARHQNGTVQNLGKVLGDAEYIDLMSRWTEWERNPRKNSQACHHYQSHLTTAVGMMRRFQCNALFLQRSARKALGLPASSDAATLSAFMKKVRGAVEVELDAPVTSIAPALPHLSPLVEEDIEEAMSFAGLVSTRNPRISSDETVYGEANAAYAGLGHGLCVSGKSDQGCKPHSIPTKEQTVVYFNFDNYSFSVGAMSIQNAFQNHRVYYDGSDSKLGWWNLPVFEVPRAKFWAQIHEMILNVLQPMSRPPNRIVLLGEHGADEEFKEVVKAAMWEQFEFDVEVMLDAVKKGDAGKLAARGAAEMGWLDGQWQRESEALRRGSSVVEEL